MKTKRNLLGLMMLAALSLAACGGNEQSVNNNGSTPANSETQNGGNTQVSENTGGNGQVSENTGGNETVGAFVDLTAASLLGYTGTQIEYNSSEATATVGGVALSYIHIGGYGDGLQMRDSEKNGVQRTTQLWNTTAFAGGIQKIELTYATSKEVAHSNPDAVIFSFGTSTAVDAYTTKLSTTSGVKTYTVTPDAATYTFFKLEHDLGYTFYWDSIKVYYAN